MNIVFSSFRFKFESAFFFHPDPDPDPHLFHRRIRIRGKNVGSSSLCITLLLIFREEHSRGIPAHPIDGPGQSLLLDPGPGQSDNNSESCSRSTTYDVRRRLSALGHAYYRTNLYYLLYCQITTVMRFLYPRGV